MALHLQNVRYKKKNKLTVNYNDGNKADDIKEKKLGSKYSKKYFFFQVF